MNILKLFPDNKVIVLPQSIYYEPTDSGNLKKKNAIRNYHKHPNLYFIAREQNTYNLLKNELMAGKDGCFALTPDIALYLKYESLGNRNKILWCLRHDGEKNNNSNVIVKHIKYLLDKHEFSHEYTDTYVNYSIPIENEEKEVCLKLQEFSKARLVITDRLHGMIYAAISGTPVIAMDNSTGKVGNIYGLWLQSIPHIRYVCDKQSAGLAVYDLLNIQDNQYNQAEFVPKYKPIINAINA